MNPTEQDFKHAETFICRMYKCAENTLDDIRVRTLVSSSKPEDNPPTSNAARFHICRSFCQAAKWLYAYSNSHRDLPSPVASGGFKTDKDGGLSPIMMTLQPMPEVLLEVATCNCQSNCQSGRCACLKSGLKCTILCHKSLKYSQGNCKNTTEHS